MLRRFARNGNQVPEETDRDHIRREPLPTARAILWKPLPDSYHLLASMMRTPKEQAQLFITQRAFLQVERHLRSAPDLELGGFLAGHLCECPRSRTQYSVVNTVVPFVDVTGDPIGARVTQKAFDTVQRRLVAHQLALLGWYRNGSGLGLQLLPDDIETHLAYFNEPWQTTMLVVPEASKSKGAFFTYDPRVGRGYCTPFYELFDAHAAESKRLDRTCVSWTTYVPATQVQPLETGEREIVETTVMPLRSEPEPQPPEPIDEWLEAIKDPWVRLKDVAVGAPQRDVPLPLVYEPALRAPSPAPKSPEPQAIPPAAPAEQRRAPEKTVVATAPGLPAPVTAAPVTAAPVTAAPVMPAPVTPAPVTPAQPKEAPRAEPTRAEPTRPAPPFAGPARAAARALAPAEPVARASDRQAPAGADIRSGTAAPRPQSPPRRAAARKPRPIPPATAAALLKAATPPAVALPADFHDDAKRWERWRRIGFAVAATSFLAAIVLSSLRPRAETAAQAVTSAAAAEGAPEPIVTVSENGEAPIPLVVAVDSLSGALAYYRAIADDHRGGRVGCRVLDRAYALVARARARVESSRGQVAGDLSDADSIRVSMLDAEYTYVAQTYRRTGCQS